MLVLLLFSIFQSLATLLLPLFFDLERTLFCYFLKFLTSLSSNWASVFPTLSLQALVFCVYIYPWWLDFLPFLKEPFLFFKSLRTSSWSHLGFLRFLPFFPSHSNHFNISLLRNFLPFWTPFLSISDHGILCSITLSLLEFALQKSKLYVLLCTAFSLSSNCKFQNYIVTTLQGAHYFHLVHQFSLLVRIKSR